jgi:mono/diheme cytochrome c family protein
MLTRLAAVAVVAAVSACAEQSTARIESTDPPSDPPGQVFGAIVAKNNCARCHDPGDGSYSGRMMAVEEGAYPPNLTPDPDTGIGSWTDDDIRTAVTTGVDDQGATLCSVMPRFSELNNDALTALVGFLRQLPPISVDIPASSCDAPSDPPMLGAVLAKKHCARCHDPGDGSYSGRMTPVEDGAYPPNLTPDPDTGIGSWTDDDIRRAVTTGVDDQGATLCSVMPRFKQLSDEDVTALIQFLKQLPPVSADIPASTCG